MGATSPYLRTFAVGAVWFAAIGIKMVSRYPGHWTTYPPQNLVGLVFGWVLTALLLGVVATRFERFRSWWRIGVGTVFGSLAVLALMVFTAERFGGRARPPKFQTTNEMMVYFAGQAAQWVKKDRGVELDYSLDSIKIIEEELARISKEIDKANPQRGTFGLAMGYGAYIGEVFRRRDGGSWAADHPSAGLRSYPLTTKSNTVLFPVGWCWKRLTSGEEDNVYHKAKMVAESRDIITKAVGSRTNEHQDR